MHGRKTGISEDKINQNEDEGNGNEDIYKQ